MKRMNAFRLFCPVILALLGLSVFSCAGRMDRYVPSDDSSHESNKSAAASNMVGMAYGLRPLSAVAVSQASDIIASDIQKAFPVFDGTGKNASEQSVPVILTETANRLLPYARFVERIPVPASLNVVVLETDEFNSFAAGNAFVFITRKMLKVAENSSQVAALLAHELAHISLGHSLASLDDSTERQIQVSAEQCLYDMMAGYGDEAEFAADSEAVEILGRAGINPQALVYVLENLSSAIEEGKPDISATHPYIFARIARLSQ